MKADKLVELAAMNSEMFYCHWLDLMNFHYVLLNAEHQCDGSASTMGADRMSAIRAHRATSFPERHGMKARRSRFGPPK